MIKIQNTTGFDMLLRLRDYFSDNGFTKINANEEPFQSELYSTDRMDHHGKLVAKSHILLKQNAKDQLLKRLEDNEKTLLEVHDLLIENIRNGKAITPGGEWLLDNFYLIEEQVVIARRHLPKGYSEGLPYLSEGVSAGMPRVYDIVLEIISHSDGRVDLKTLSSFVASYQTETMLTLGELWAIPIMLRLAVLDNLRRVCAKIALDMVDHNMADYWADRMIQTIADEPSDIILTVADMARSKPVLAGPFVAGFTRKLQGKGSALALPLSWMEQRLSTLGLTGDDLVRQENQKQAADQVSVRNSIGTLRFLGATDWRDFVEALSGVEKLLRLDPSGTYPLMDFATRDRYRHVVESISKNSKCSETDVAQKALDLALNDHYVNPTGGKQGHIGYYLIDKGLAKTELAAKRHYKWSENIVRQIGRNPVGIYLLSVAILTVLIAALMLHPAIGVVHFGWMMFVWMAVLCASCAGQLSVSLINWLCTIWITPRLLPRMNFAGGIPVEYRTLLVIPTMIPGASYIEEMIEALEIRFLANKEDHLYFALLTDFPDEDARQMPDDDILLDLAKNRIDALNQKYSTGRDDIFFLFHRPRTWNPRENKWMGYERKRGKLSALNALLRGKGRDAFSLICGNYDILQGVKYVITLDSDTKLPRDSAWKFIATMAHPLNKGVYDQVSKRVTEGYGILQPRLASSLPKSGISLYSRMQGDVSGIDPYTQVSSDVYQDLFQEGSFIGKGIYDVDIFEQAVDAVFQENRILSHDLLEGCYTRSGLISDVLLYEENPSSYESDVRRHHRWIRGDWQVGAWMLPFVTTNTGRLVLNRLSGLSRWKILDNLRRSLVPASLILLLLTGWILLPLPWWWTLTVTIVVLLPVMSAAGWQLVNKPRDLHYKAHLGEIGSLVGSIFARFSFGLAVLPFQAYQYTDAVLRANWRMIVSRRKLLEWTPSASFSSNEPNGIITAYFKMWMGPFLSLICAALLAYLNLQSLLVAGPILLLWLLGPAITWRLGIEEVSKSPALTSEQILFLHRSARKTWSFFQEFVTAHENWLPPDNFQLQPAPVIAHRTSPTNLGLALLANLTAYDFGYIAAGEVIWRCENTLTSMLRLERYKGHFYNWYDTISLKPLAPRYVSTVDSGNLIGHLLTLRQGLISLRAEPIFNARLLEGLKTTIRIVDDLGNGEDPEPVEKMVALLDAHGDKMDSLTSLRDLLDSLLTQAALQQVGALHTILATKWAKRLLIQIQAIRDDLEELFPWVGLLPVPAEFANRALLDEIPPLADLGRRHRMFCEQVSSYMAQSVSPETRTWLTQVQTILATKESVAHSRIKKIEWLAAQCENLSTVEYDFLYEKSTFLLRIGYNVDDQRKDDSFYDLLASEARLGIFVAIAQGKLPQESWFALGRLLTNTDAGPILLSWSGSMFEYLMPQLVMPGYENTLLEQTSKGTVKRQIQYGLQRGIPWGISESAYHMVDSNLNYQYKAFGVPGLGLKRGLEEDLVVAPYASMMALMVSPSQACLNLQLLSKEGLEGEYGFYEAVDYTPSRMPRGTTRSILYSFMVHHQGMGFLSLSYLLCNKPLQQRFIAELRFQATLLLLQERVPRATLFHAHTADLTETRAVTIGPQVRKINSPHTLIPEIQLLSNGRYQVMVSSAGGGYSSWKDMALTRWREDTTRDDRGTFCYIKDVDSGQFWSNTHQPTLVEPKSYEALFSVGHVEFARHDHQIDTRTEIVVSPEDDTEMRKIRITNRSLTTRILEVTSYAEVVLASQASDESHPAFSNLFVQTEIIPDQSAIFCTRRPRSRDEHPPWMFHQMEVHSATIHAVSYETDRMEFIGRGKTLISPDAMRREELSGNEGAVLDPIVAIRYRISLKPGQTASIDMVYGISETRAGCEGLMHKYRDKHLKKRAFELSWTHNQVLLRQINASESQAQLYNRMAASLIYSNPALRADPALIASNFRGQSGLWSHSVSGDLPIVLLHIYNPDSLALVKEMVQAHAYWRLKGLAVDLVIWNEDHGSYRQFIQEQILGLISADAGNNVTYSKPGNIFVKSADQISPEDRILFESVARVIIRDHVGPLAAHVTHPLHQKSLPPLLEKRSIAIPEAESQTKLPNDLLFFNGTGGFTPDGKEYKILTNRNSPTPAPWVNVIANPDFGTVISESGSAYTWAINAHEYRITPWANDPVSDTGGEAFYLRDEETGSFWSPCPFPAPSAANFITTHGFGYTMFEHATEGISTEMCVFVDKGLPVKFIVLKIRNESGIDRRLSATGFLEVVQGDLRSKTSRHIISELDSEKGALLIRNRYNTAFAERVTFFTVDAPLASATADRTEFIGRNRNAANPQAMQRRKLAGSFGAGIDPCAALQVRIDLPNGEEKEVVFQIGNGENIYAVHSLLAQFERKDDVIRSYQEVRQHWKELLGMVEVTTPDVALNILANGWLTYQTLACRIFARSGFYQSGGAFGFRDQLQDVIALLPARPDIARKQIILSASRQFVEGDVQHWWHPPEGRGVRTHCSDDLLWLPYVVEKYVTATGDLAILTEPIGYLESRLLQPQEESLYDLPVSGNLVGSLYEHCVRAIRHSLRFGSHGLPLIGSGDWNDGMDQVGNKGKGESVWLAFFLYDVLTRFEKLSLLNGHTSFADTCQKEAAALKVNIEKSAWDGEWYKRAWFDDGTELGSSQGDECKIDAIAQSWSVLSGAGEPDRVVKAMASLDKYLVKRDLRLIQLLDPPFDKSDVNPGYIKGYVPGIRENGGQYSHAAVWSLMAFAKLGQRERVYELFNMIHPIGLAMDSTGVQRYKVEPYVMAADVYANPSHGGRGGWTWYTGSSGWMYQFITSSLLGMELRADELHFRPCFPLDWPSVSITYRFKTSVYYVTVFQVQDLIRSYRKISEETVEGDTVPLTDDGMQHHIEVYISLN